MKAVVKKQQAVDSIVESFKGATSIYLFNYQGLTVQKDNALRCVLNTKGIKYRVVKNTLLKRVLEKLDVKGLDDFLKGATSVMVGSKEDPIAPAREIEVFHKDNPNILLVKSIFLDGKIRPASDIVELSKIPDRKGMLSQLVAIILGPGATIAGQLKTLQEKLEDGSDKAESTNTTQETIKTE